MIRFDHVTFGYEAERPVLRELSLEIPEGGRVCLTGASGQGKTTALRLLLELEQPQSGAVIRPDGTRFSVVFQEDRLLPWKTALENAALTGSAEDAREVTQDAFLAAWRGLPAFRGDSRFSSWLYRLTTNAAIDFLRREKHHLGNLPLEEAPERTDPQQPELLAEQREQQEALQRALDQLSPEHRQVLLLRVVQQLSYDEIAQALSLESGTVKSRISRARRQLREILLRQGNFFPDSAVLPNGKEG